MIARVDTNEGVDVVDVPAGVPILSMRQRGVDAAALDAERQLVGSLLIDANAVADLVVVDDIHDGRLARIAAIALAMATRGESPLPIAVAREINDPRIDVSFVIDTMEEAYTLGGVAAAAGSAALVRENAERRRVVDVARRVALAAADGGDTDALRELLNSAPATSGGRSRITDSFAPLPPGCLSTKPEARQFVLRWTTTPDGQPAAPRQGHGFASAGIVGVLSSAGGTGKSWFLLMLAACIVLGRRFLGFDVDAEFVGRRCCLTFGEETAQEVHRRLWAIASFFGLSAEDRHELEQKLIVLPLHGKSCGLIAPDRDGGLPTPTPALDDLCRRLSASPEPWGLIALDPASRLLPGHERDNDSATFAVQMTERLTSMPGNPLVLVSGHSSKVARRNNDVDARGATGLTDAARLHITLLKQKDGTVHLAAPKSNYAPDIDKPLILKREGAVFRLASDAELKADGEAVVEAEANQVETDARKMAAALALSPVRRVRTIDDCARLAKIGNKRGRPAMTFALGADWIRKVKIEGQAFYVPGAGWENNAPPYPPAGAGVGRPGSEPGADTAAAQRLDANGASMGRRGVGKGEEEQRP